MNMKRLCSTLILTFVLTTSAFAGGMEIGEIVSPSAPATAPAQGSGTAITDTSSATTGDAVSGADVSVTEGALGLVGAVLALF
jgi:hypothetical protein